MAKIIDLLKSLTRAPSAANCKKISDFFNLAENQRYADYSKGKAELRRRESEQAGNAAFARHMAFAEIVDERVQALQESKPELDRTAQSKDQNMCVAWCSCFLMPEDYRRLKAMVVDEGSKMLQLAFFAYQMEARGRLGSGIHSGKKLEPSSKLQAESRLRSRWEDEAVVVNFDDDAYKSFETRSAWIASLDAGTLHEIGCEFNWDTNELHTLQAITEHPLCDKATAMMLFSLSGRCYDTIESENVAGHMEGDIDKLLTTILKRATNEDFATSLFSPGSDLAANLKVRDNILESGKTPRWDFPDTAFVGFKGQPHKPKYSYDGDLGKLMLPYESWRKLKMITP